MIYFIQAGKNGPIKIGHTENDIEQRIAQLQTGCPYELRLIWLKKGDQQDEAEWHSWFQHERIRGEWFRPSRDLINCIKQEGENEYIDPLVNGGYIETWEGLEKIFVNINTIKINRKINSFYISTPIADIVLDENSATVFSNIPHLEIHKGDPNG